MAGRPLSEVWSKYVSSFRKGVQTTSKENLILYDGDSKTAKKIGTIPKDVVIHVGPINAPNYIPRMPVTYRQGDNDPVQGWVRSLGIKKPSTGSNTVSFSLKPQDFPNVGGTKLNFLSYYNNIISSINNRSDLPDVVKNYLVQLVEYCNTHSQGDRIDLVSAYSSLSDSAYSSCDNLVAKDFSELIAPICVLQRGSSYLVKMGFTNLNVNNASIFVPTAGNYPLVDFIINDTEGREYPFSVKAMSSTTNVIKPQDLMKFVDDNAQDAFIIKFKNTPEYEVLRLLGQTNKGVAETTYETIRYLAQTQPFKSVLPANLDKIVPENPSHQNFTDTIIDDNMETWNSMYDTWMSGARHLSNPSLTTGAKGKYNQLSYLMAVAVGKISQRRTSGLNYLEIVRDFLMEQVSYYKFKINNNGMPEFKIENKFHNEFNVNSRLVLRTKASKGSPLNDRLGVQP